MTAPWLTARTGDPKGLAPYNPQGWKQGVVADVLALFAEYESDAALPVGPRTSGYGLSQRENPSGLRYTKNLWLSGRAITPYAVSDARVTERVLPGWATFKDVEDAIKRLRQAEHPGLPWEWVSDGSAVRFPVSAITSAMQFADETLDPDEYEHDLRVGQSLVLELHSESAELTPFLRGVAAPFGVHVESGRGSGGPDLGRRVAIRAWNRYAGEPRQRTLLLGVGDLDLEGVQNVMRPHVEHVGAFLRGFAEKQDKADPYGLAAEILDFRRVAITVEQALTLAPALPNVGETERKSLVAYAASGECDWTRDIRLLKAKIEVEALGPQRLRDALIAAMEGRLDVDRLAEQAHEEALQADEIRAMRETLGLKRREAGA